MIRPVDELNPALVHHIANTLGWTHLRPLQESAIAPLLAGEHCLLLAPTAGGKTEAAIFPLLSSILDADTRGLSLIYVCPLKALANNLHERLERYLGLVGRRAGLWHGDVSTSARRRIVADPPDLLLTTPESLEVMLISTRTDERRLFANLQAVIIDEIHAFAGDDRGWHLMGVLERLETIAGRTIQRVGLSATVGNPTELLDWLAGHCAGDRSVIGPDADAGSTPADVTLDYVGSIDNAATVVSRLHRGEKRLVFCDSRSQVEQLASLLRGRDIATFVSHSSLSTDERRQSERAFADADNCVIVATSTLELGIDIGDLDRVVQIDAPSTVASFLQRLGRTGRRRGSARNCLFLTTTDDALARAAGLLRLWADGYVEPIEPPASPTHIFAQQLMALALQEGRIGRNLWRDWIGRLEPFAAMLAGEIDAIVAHMLDERILFEDAGMLTIGTGGETAFGRRHFSEITSVFTSDPMLRVTRGRTDLGVVHPLSLQRRDHRPIVLSLGGRPWLVKTVDWERRIVHVEPTQGRGRSRWAGTPFAMNAALCGAIRSIYAGDDPPVDLTKRARAQLSEIRDKHRWARPEGTFVVSNPDDDRLRWWTFAGLRANAVLAGALSPFVDGQPNNLTIPLTSHTSLHDITDAIRPSPPTRVPVDPGMIDGLKFRQCLPPALVEKMLAQRLGDPEAVAAVAGGPIRLVST